MNSLFLFYWLGWLIVIIVYFFVERIHMRNYFLYTMFLIMLLIHVYVPLYGNLHVTGAFIVLCISTFYYYIQLQLSYYDIFVTITVIFCYLALLLWEKVAPIWFVMNPIVMIPLIVCALITMLTTSFSKQIAITMFGLPIGQLLFGYILVDYGLSEQQGGQHFFVFVFTHILILITFYIIALLFQRKKTNITY